MIRATWLLAAAFSLSAAGMAAAAASAPGPAFQPNLGQFDAQVAFVGVREEAHLFVTRAGELVHRFPAADGGAWVLVERFDQAAALRPSNAEPMATRIGWIGPQGNRSAAAAQRIALGEPWRGIHADLNVAEHGYEKRFHLAPGVDAAAIGMTLDGIDGMQRTDDGRLLLRTGIGHVEMSAPIAWQDIDGARVPVQVAYRIAGEATYGFVLGTHDPAHGVTIDPIVRSTFSGGNGEESLEHLAVAPDSVYILGWTKSADFPGTAGGHQSAIIRNTTLGSNVYVARYSPDLRTLMQATYFGVYGPIPDSGGQSGGLMPREIAISAAGVYVSGTAPGVAPVGGMHLPGTTGGLQAAPAGGQGDAFIARFSHDLTTLHQATYYGGPSHDDGWPIALAEDGVYIAGVSGSTTLAGLENGAYGDPPQPAGTGAAYVAKLSLDLTSALSASWISTGGWDMYPRTMAVDADGNVYVGGDGRNGLFDTNGAFQPARASSNFPDGFIVRLSADLSQVHRSTWLGGSGVERVDAIAWGENAIYVTGHTVSSNFPIAPDAALSVYSHSGGSGSGYIAALSSDLASRVGATYYAGTANPAGIALSDGQVFVAGTIGVSTLPASEGAAEPTNPGPNVCGFAARMNPGLSQFHRSSFVACAGGIKQFYGMGIGHDVLYMAGRTQQDLTLPGSEDGAQPTKSGSYDAFIIASTADLGGPRPVADLEVSKTGSEEPIAGRWVLYDIVVRNLGPDPAVGARIQDLLPPELTAAGWTCTGSGGATCPQGNGTGSIDAIATLPNGGELVYSLCARSNGAALIVNTAQASVAEDMLDPVSANNHASAVTQDDSLFSDGFEDLNLPPWCPPAD